MQEKAIGIISGSGLYEIEGFEDIRFERVATPFGDPSDEYIVGRYKGRKTIFLPRHSKGHVIMPSEINFRANIYGFKKLGAESIISVSAVGSMRERIQPLDIVIPDQFFDWTKRRKSTFFGDGIVAHVGMASPVCPDLSKILFDVTKDSGCNVHMGGTYICIEGPQFSMKAESKIFRQWGVDIIGMTSMPEAKLAREAELCYATLALVTDYDVWHESEEEVSVEAVIENLKKNVQNAKEIIKRAIPLIPEKRDCECPHALKNAIITDKEKFNPETRVGLELLIKKYFPESKYFQSQEEK